MCLGGSRTSIDFKVASKASPQQHVHVAIVLTKPSLLAPVKLDKGKRGVLFANLQHNGPSLSHRVGYGQGRHESCCVLGAPVQPMGWDSGPDIVVGGK